ncbi:MAG: mechanosensitive ion channel family protein [Propionibacteriaceae bacterium]|nr:mechanosensitive ion channel family protein [Propionibacteriaceae bacterium]
MILLTWPDDVILIGLTILAALVSHGVLVFAVTRIVRRLTAHDPLSSDKIGARAARVMAATSGLSLERHRQRTMTLGSLLRNLVTVAIYSVMILTIMSILGIPMAPLLASAGVGGIALGFGAQALVKDFLSGVFMIAEDQYGVGDHVRIGEISGTVEEVTLRITKIRDASGMAWYIRNGEVLTVGNVSQGWSTAIIDIPVAYDEDPERVLGLLEGVASELDTDEVWSQHLLDTPVVAGVESIAGGTMTLRLIAKCAPNQQFGVQRELRQRAKSALDAAGIRGPRLLMGETR